MEGAEARSEVPRPVASLRATAAATWGAARAAGSVLWAVALTAPWITWMVLTTVCNVLASC